MGGWLEINKGRQGLLGGGNEGRRESVNTIMNKMRNEEQINMYLIVVERTYTTLNYEHDFFMKAMTLVMITIYCNVSNRIMSFLAL